MNSKLEKADEWINDTEDKMENNEAEKKSDRGILQHENRFKELSDSIKQ